ncbi:hypothetical protein GGI18_000657 [Coemansia linderi]|uniref:Uncharacterized protein n=1 Tax=Coemansia linderi TaxID=2663919 RepID=A0ACC1KNS1_9FUNG|nr:hypothetical protein GGI18_000657 [Coemansia linderi]
MFVYSMQHSATAADHHSTKPMVNAYYQDNPGAHGTGGVAASNGMMGSWPGADSQQYQHGCNTTDTACSSPLETPLAKIMQQQQHATSSVAGANGVSGGSGAEPIAATAHLTPPQSAASHGFSNAHNPDAWRAYQNPYHQGIPVPGAYSAAAFASPISSGMPTGLDNGSFEHSADYYYGNNGHQAPHSHQHPHQLTHPAPGTMSAHQPSSIADMHQLHYQQSHAQAMGVDRDGAGQHSHHSQQQSQQHHQQHPGLHHHDPSSVSQFDHAAAAAASAAAAAGNPHYMGDFGHGMYAGAQEIASAPASVMHLPPIDPASSLSRHNSYFNMAGSPNSSFDPMSAAAVAAAAAAAASTGTYSPHPAGHNQYMTAAAARGQQPYPSTMMIGRFNMGGMPSNSAPGAIPTPPPPTSSMQSPHQHQHQPPPLGSSASSMSVSSTPSRPLGMTRMNSHGQSSTTQRKRYLCTVCQKMFARPSTLSTHMHSHTGEKPYECTWDGCEKRFSVMSNLRRHQRIHERQRQKYANVQQQQHNQIKPADASGDESSDESTTPLASQMHAVAAHGHHHRHPHHMSPPPGFSQPPMLASHAPGGMSASLGMHHHGLPSLHHPHHQPHPHQNQHHLLAPVTSQQHYQHPHYQHQPPSMSDALTKHSVGPNSIHEDASTAVMSANEESVPMLNGASTTSTNTINPTTPQSSGLKD